MTLEYNFRSLFRRMVMLSDNDTTKIAEQNTDDISKKKLNDLIAALKKIEIARMPKDDPIDAIGEYPGERKVRSKDGSLLLIDSIADGKHLVRTRWSPDYESRKRGLSDLVDNYSTEFKDAGLWKEVPR